MRALWSWTSTMRAQMFLNVNHESPYNPERQSWEPRWSWKSIMKAPIIQAEPRLLNESCETCSISLLFAKHCIIIWFITLPPSLDWVCWGLQAKTRLSHHTYDSLPYPRKNAQGFLSARYACAMFSRLRRDFWMSHVRHVWYRYCLLSTVSLFDSLLYPPR